MKTRIVEVFVGIGGPDSGEWYIRDTEVPSEYGRSFAGHQAQINVRKGLTERERETVKFVVAGKVYSNEEMEALQ